MSQNKGGNASKTVGKYGAMIQKARSLENQQTREPENSPEDAGEPVSGDTAHNQNTGKLESQYSGLQENLQETLAKEEEVNLSIKVPKRLRRHWVSEAKKRDTSLTAIITASLKERLGEPQDS